MIVNVEPLVPKTQRELEPRSTSVESLVARVCFADELAFENRDFGGSGSANEVTAG